MRQFIDCQSDFHGRYRLDVGDCLYFEKDDKYGKVTKIWDSNGEYFVKIIFFIRYDCNLSTGIDFALCEYTEDFKIFNYKTLSIPVVVVHRDNYTHFISSLRFDLNYSWLEEHI